MYIGCIVSSCKASQCVWRKESTAHVRASGGRANVNCSQHAWRKASIMHSLSKIYTWQKNNRRVQQAHWGKWGWQATEALPHKDRARPNPIRLIRIPPVAHNNTLRNTTDVMYALIPTFAASWSISQSCAACRAVFSQCRRHHSTKL